jgi:hypothetical protein
MYFPIDYYRFRNYRNIGAVFVFDNIVSISFSRKRCENESDLASYRSFPIVFIPINEAEAERSSMLRETGGSVSASLTPPTAVALQPPHGRRCFAAASLRLRSLTPCAPSPWHVGRGGPLHPST